MSNRVVSACVSRCVHRTLEHSRVLQSPSLGVQSIVLTTNQEIITSTTNQHIRTITSEDCVITITAVQDIGLHLVSRVRHDFSSSSTRRIKLVRRTIAVGINLNRRQYCRCKGVVKLDALNVGNRDNRAGFCVSPVRSRISPICLVSSQEHNVITVTTVNPVTVVGTRNDRVVTGARRNCIAASASLNEVVLRKQRRRVFRTTGKRTRIANHIRRERTADISRFLHAILIHIKLTDLNV